MKIHHIKLASEISKNILEFKIKKEKRKIKGLDFLWNISQENSNLPRNLADAAANFLMKILQDKYGKPFKMYYANLCMENIQKGESPSTSINLLLSLLGKKNFFFFDEIFFF
jgi:hypothetical protein